MTGSLTQSALGLNITPFLDAQGDLARLTNTLRAVIEVNETCWRGDDCELSNGVRTGLEQFALHTQRHSEIAEIRVSQSDYNGSVCTNLPFSLGACWIRLLNLSRCVPSKNRCARDV